MTKFNKTGARATPRSAVRTVQRDPAVRTHQGGQGYDRDAKGELFQLALANLGADTFYEKGEARDERMVGLIHQVAAGDPQWLTGFAGWLRRDAGMRRSSVMVVAEGIKGMTDAGVPGGRQLVSATLARSDEPGELLAYWLTTYGRGRANPLKRGISDVLPQLYTEYALLKYDTDAHAVRFGDVVEYVHARPPLRYLTDETGPDMGYVSDLYRYAIDRRHKRDNPVPASLVMVQASIALRKAATEDASVLLDTGALRAAGMTWEDALSLAAGRVDKARLWEALTPVMGYEALLKNLRNFSQAGISMEAKQAVAARLADPEKVARSRQFPMAFMAAYRAADDVFWSYPLEVAMGHSLANLPKLDGSTLILVDTSRSMRDPFSKDGKVMRWDAAAQFGIALGQACERANVVSFSGRGYTHERRYAMTEEFPLRKGESLVKALDRWMSGGYFLDHGTDTALALRKHFAGHKRVVVVTDEQAGEDPREVTASIPAEVPMYTWNLAGYARGHAPSGTKNRHAFGGLNDRAFRAIPLLESGRDSAWPWEG